MGRANIRPTTAAGRIGRATATGQATDAAVSLTVGQEVRDTSVIIMKSEIVLLFVAYHLVVLRSICLLLSSSL